MIAMWLLPTWPHFLPGVPLRQPSPASQEEQENRPWRREFAQFCLVHIMFICNSMRLRISQAFSSAPGSRVGLSLFLTHTHENIKWKLQLPLGQEKHWDLSFNSKYLLSIVFQFLSRCLECTNEQNRPKKKKTYLPLWSSHSRGIFFFNPMWMIVSNSSVKWYLMGRGIDKVGEPQTWSGQVASLSGRVGRKGMSDRVKFNYFTVLSGLRPLIS